MRARTLRLCARLAAAAVAGTVTMALLAPASNAIVLPHAYVSLHGEGAWSVSQELVSWQNQLSTAGSAIDLNYSGRGSLFGREDLASGQADFAISGLPFRADELAHVNGGAGAFIDAPVQVAALAPFVAPPYFGFNTVNVVCDPDDPTTWPPGQTDPDGCVERGHLPGAPKIPNRNLAAMLLNYNGVGDPLTHWNNGDILSANGVQQFAIVITNPGPDAIGRSDPDETTYFLQQFVKTAEPDVWLGNQSTLFHPSPLWEPVSERLPENVGATRDGAEQQVDQLEGVGVGGGITAAPPAMIRSFRSTFPGAQVFLADMQNANGDWVAPTPAAIDKAVDAGGDTPLYALTNKVAGAYPLVWVDRLYAPAHGLSIEKTEGLAMLIRYLVTTGQEKEAAAGDGRLSASLVAQALRAADELVVSNCQGSDRRLVMSSDPGPLAPATAKAMRSIGSMAHCEPAPGATTTSTVGASATTIPTVTPTSTPLLPDAGSSGSPSPGGTPTVSASPAGGSTSNTTTTDTATGQPSAAVSSRGATASTPRNALLTASNLPLPSPTSSTGGDRFATFLLGAVLYLLVRKPVGRLARKVAT